MSRVSGRRGKFSTTSCFGDPAGFASLFSLMFSYFQSSSGNNVDQQRQRVGKHYRLVKMAGHSQKMFVKGWEDNTRFLEKTEFFSIKILNKAANGSCSSDLCKHLTTC